MYHCTQKIENGGLIRKNIKQFCVYMLYLSHLKNPINTHFFFRVPLIFAFCIFINNLKAQNIPYKPQKSDTIAAFTSKNILFYQVNKIIIEGNRITHPKIITRELFYREGSYLPVSKVDSLLAWERNKIFNTNLFVTVDVKLIPAEVDGMADLVIKVKEQWYTIPQLILEPADRNLNEWLFQRGAGLERVNYGIKLFQRNMRGRNETLRLTAQGGFTHNYEISYDIPYIDKRQKIGIKPFFAYSNNRTMAYANQNHKLEFLKSENILRNFYRGGIGINFRNAFFANHNWEVSYHNNRIEDTIAKLNPEYFLNGNTKQTYFNFKYIFTYDKRDIRQYAQKGFYMQLQAEQSGFTYLETQRISKLMLAYHKYWTLSERFFAASKWKARTTYPNLQPFIDFIGLGYKNDFVRGFELYPVDGQHFLLNRNSLRYKFFSRILDFGKLVPIQQFRTMPLDLYATAFADAGIAFNNRPIRNYPLLTIDNSRFSNKPLASVGAGLHIVTFYQSIIRLEYSKNSAGEWNFAIGLGTDI